MTSSNHFSGFSQAICGQFDVIHYKLILPPPYEERLNGQHYARVIHTYLFFGVTTNNSIGGQFDIICYKLIPPPYEEWLNMLMGSIMLGPKLKRFWCFSGIHPEWVRNRSKPNKTSFMTFQSCHVKTIYNY